MSNHLTEDQFANSFIGQSTSEEREHLAACPQCTAESDRLRHNISLFRSALSVRVENRIALSPALEIQPSRVADPKWRWALVAATALVLAVMPFVGIKTRIVPPQSVQTTQAEDDADALMRAVQLQLSRTIPAPMEPVIALLPTEESTPTRGVQ